MNYYSPFYMMYPVARPSLFRTIRNSFRSINFGNILSGTQRTLNIVNQAIPLVKQIKPVVRNAGTMFKVMNEFKKTDAPWRENCKNSNCLNNEVMEEYGEGPKFFV